MRRLCCASSTPFLLLALACSPSTNGIADGSGSNEDETGDGDGDSAGDGDGDSTGDGDGDGDPTGDGDGDGDGDPSGDGDGDNTCSSLGCDCNGTPGSCDPTLMCVAGTCVVATCGNGVVDDQELCDDANQIDGDGCDADCTLTDIEQVVAGGRHTCALIEAGRVRCWGEGSLGVLGLGSSTDIGDNETPADSTDIPLPRPVVAIDAGDVFVCAKFDDGGVGCWGVGVSGQLGNVDTVTLGDNETLDALPPIDLGGEPSSFSLGGSHACAAMPNDAIRCWGRNADGQLGIGSKENIGDDETPGSIPVIEVGASIMAAAGTDHSCAITTGLDLACWGKNGRGQLGYGNTNSIGDDAGETPMTSGKLDLYSDSLPNGATLESVSLGKEHSCALFSSGDVVCWGRNDHGQLGQGNTDDYGDDNGETPALLALIDLGGDATAISAGESHTCAIVDGGDVRCWGFNDKGQLGLGPGGDNAVGDDELPSEVTTVDVGGAAVAISAGAFHTCVLLDSNEVVCWGDNTEGRLGYGHTMRIGDDETPASQGGVDIL